MMMMMTSRRARFARERMRPLITHLPCVARSVAPE